MNCVKKQKYDILITQMNTIFDFSFFVEFRLRKVKG